MSIYYQPGPNLDALICIKPTWCSRHPYDPALFISPIFLLVRTSRLINLPKVTLLVNDSRVRIQAQAIQLQLTAMLQYLLLKFSFITLHLHIYCQSLFFTKTPKCSVPQYSFTELIRSIAITDMTGGSKSKLELVLIATSRMVTLWLVSIALPAPLKCHIGHL